MIECIPNFSEGRNSQVVDAIADAVRAVAGVYVLDLHSDADHNRSVLTFAGDAGAVKEAAFRAVEAAALLIDMRQHSGQHPRIGATDVLPFVPLRDATLAQCAEIARAVGRRVADELHIPVYFYGAAARAAEQRELPALRKGEYEALRELIKSDPARRPDFGPRELGSAGATAIGARPPLIAYNLFLSTGDLRIAKQIARAVRGSSGGLRGVRALGMLVGGRAQVSMNLIDFRSTPVHRAVDLVVREAANYGVLVMGGELVGLMPEDALIDAGRTRLYLPQLGDAQVLERRLAQVIAEQRRSKTLRERLQERAEQQRGDHDYTAAPLQSELDAIWMHSVQALAASVGDLSIADLPNRVRAMLRVLSRDLLDGVNAERSGSADRAQVLLLMARRAVKAAEVLDVSAIDTISSARAAVIVHLAHSVVATARLRALELLPMLDERQRALLIQEFNLSAQRARDLLAQVDPVT
ncbi:MAG: glutamate formimidoyltransferase [Roseiflexaceae bacterium]|nr:glutamate formimidoyltransferase [Roseiflexaceae bacterium]